MSKTYEKSVKFIARNDYAAVVNGQEVGYASTKLDAQRIADDYVLAQIEHDNQCQAAEVAALAAPSSRPYVTRAALDAVIEAAATYNPRDKRWANALASAAKRLRTIHWQFDGSRLLIHSARPETGHKYVVQPGMCDERCDAARRGQPCWHRAARKLVALAAHRTSAAA